MRVVLGVVDDRAAMPQQRLPLPAPAQHVASAREADEAQRDETARGDERHALVAGEPSLGRLPAAPAARHAHARAERTRASVALRVDRAQLCTVL